MSITLSHYQLAPVLTAHRQSQSEVELSPDLGLTPVRVTLDADGILFPGGDKLSWRDAETIARSENGCFVLLGGTIQKIQTFSEFTQRAYSLYPTASAPTMLVAGFPMHRIKGSDPWQDTLAKVKTISPVVGRVLDTATGLGYTAIVAAHTAEEVVTIELDPAAQEIARQNPWSAELFTSSRIRQIIGDSYEVVEGLDDESFARVIHDPPTMSLAGDLYSEAFYKELARVLKRGGVLFHYVGDPESRFGGNVTRGVIERLKRAGFQRVEPRSEAFGVRAVKPRR